MVEVGGEFPDLGAAKRDGRLRHVRIEWSAVNGPTMHAVDGLRTEGHLSSANGIGFVQSLDLSAEDLRDRWTVGDAPRDVEAHDGGGARGAEAVHEANAGPWCQIPEVDECVETLGRGECQRVMTYRTGKQTVIGPDLSNRQIGPCAVCLESQAIPACVGCVEET